MDINAAHEDAKDFSWPEILARTNNSLLLKQIIRLKEDFCVIIVSPRCCRRAYIYKVAFCFVYYFHVLLCDALAIWRPSKADFYVYARFFSKFIYFFVLVCRSFLLQKEIINIWYRKYFIFFSHTSAKKKCIFF